MTHASRFCTRGDLETPWYAAWRDVLGVGRTVYRKHWELAAIGAALEDRGLLAEGRRGLGFGVGRECLPSAFAARGCEIVATDLGAAEWGFTAPAGFTAADLCQPRLCPPDVYAARVTQRQADMRAIPADLREFDFCWSSCALDHLGSIADSEAFVLNSLETLRPGGVAVHTAEYALTPGAPRSGGTVYLSLLDVTRLAWRIAEAGHRLAPLDWNLGRDWEDHYCDQPPYSSTHLKLWTADNVLATSLILIVEKHA